MATALLWGSTPILEKIGLARVDPLIDVTIRSTIVTAGLFCSPLTFPPSPLPSRLRGGEGTDGGEDEETEKNESFEGSLEEKECQTLIEEV